MQRAQDVLEKAVEAGKHGRWGEAETLLCKLIEHDDDVAFLYFALGNIYLQVGAYGRALAFLQMACAKDDKATGAMGNLASLYRMLGKIDKARYWAQKALALERNPQVLSNLAGTYLNAGNPEPALQYAEEALALKPDFPEAGNHRALALLELGRFEDGWKQYDSRLELGLRTPEGTVSGIAFHRRPYTVPMWKGEPVKLLAIHGEQGLGDEIMFLTCLKQIRERYDIGDVVIECSPRLVKLLHSSLGVRCYGTHDELVAAERPDAYIAMGSLPGFIWPVVPHVYLKPTTSYAHSREKFRIGLSWFGGSLLTHRELRNAPVEQWRTFYDLDAQLMSLQYGQHEDEAEELGVRHDGKSIADLDILAAMIRSCDLVVSVCNTTIHMAGALGVPCLVLVPASPAWRYGLTGEKMAWYDSVTMMRQARGEEWPSVLARAKDWVADFRKLPRAQRAVA